MTDIHDTMRRRAKETSGEVTVGTEASTSGNPAESRWKKWWTRTYSTLGMFGAFIGLMYLGPGFCMVLVFILQILVVREIQVIRITKIEKDGKAVDLIGLFKFFDWYFYVCTVFNVMGRLLIPRIVNSHPASEMVLFLASRHQITTLWLYVAGFVVFVLTLKKGCYKAQFVQLGWTMAINLFIVVQSSFHVHMIFEGLAWFFIPCGLVICNDVFAYIWGFFFGRTPLIQLSPRKTWEGFLGGMASTWVIGFIVAYLICQVNFMVCPRDELFGIEYCEPGPLYVMREFLLPEELTQVLQKVGIQRTTVSAYPFQLHALALATFASVIAPFGGFFASGFKRAFKIKDFGDMIPGHGGLMDRMDCQLIMGIFTYTYYATFIISHYTLESILSEAYSLPDEQQVELYRTLGTVLGKRELI